MSTHESKEIQPKEKREIATPAEQTTPGPSFTPSVDICETDKTITLVADMPGVKAKDLNIDLNENVLTISGSVDKPEGSEEMDLFREYDTGRYFRQFSLSELIDQAKIEAKLSDGVLRLTLPKVEKAAPRKISVKTS